MKQLLMFIALVAIAVATYSFIKLQESSQQMVVLSQNMQRMEEHAQTLEQRIVELERENAQLREESLGHIIENAEQGVVEKWGQMAEHFSTELQKLGKMLEDELAPKPTPQSEDQSDDAESI